MNKYHLSILAFIWGLTGCSGGESSVTDFKSTGTLTFQASETSEPTGDVNKIDFTAETATVFNNGENAEPVGGVNNLSL